ncbi:uncharacterized protein LOC128931381 [Callithrix jacchus]
MATAGISRSGRPEAAPAGLAAARAKSDPSPGGAKWTKGDPQAGALGALGIRGIPSVRQSEGLEAAEGDGNPPSAAPGGPRRPAQLRSAAQRSGLHSWPPPLSPLRKPGGSNQQRSPLLEPRRRAWRLRALSWAGNIMHFPLA